MSVVGEPLSRVDGGKKVTGGALYTADAAPTGALHGSLVNSTIASGRIKRLDVSAAGVVRIPTMPPPYSDLMPPPHSRMMPPPSEEVFVSQFRRA